MYRQFIGYGWLSLYLAVILLTGCSSVETPPTAGPVITEAPATPLPVDSTRAAFTPAVSPPGTPVPSPTFTLPPTRLAVSPTSTVTPRPTAFSQQGDILPQPSPTGSFGPGTPAAALRVPCAVGAGAMPLRNGPDASYAPIQTVSAGAPLSALKHTADGMWLLVETENRVIGWASAAALSCQGDLSSLPIAQGVGTPAAAAPPPAAPTPTLTVVASPTLPAPSTGAWRGEYYDNPSLAGEPVLVRDDPSLDFNWGLDSPAPGIPADNFSVRWTRPFEFAEEGDYRFFADVDDGVKLYLDGWLIIDEWNTNPYILHSGVFARVKPGVHTVTVEYFESGGMAHVKSWFEKTLVSGDKWVGEYYNNPEFRDAPVLVREDDDIDFDWDDDAPASGMQDDFSVRWQRTVVLDAGDYEFEAITAEEDRIKLYLDEWLIVEEHTEEPETVKGTFRNVGSGYHTIKVEYQDYSGDARIKINWERDD